MIVSLTILSIGHDKRAVRSRASGARQVAVVAVLPS